MFFKRFMYYINPLNLFKKDKEAGLNLRMMHGINKVSFLAFLLCIAVMAWRHFTR